MSQVVLEGITKRFGDVVAVDDVSLTVEDEEMLVLLGPSGCGKSTVLRIIAGLEEPTAVRPLFTSGCGSTPAAPQPSPVGSRVDDTGEGVT